MLDYHFRERLATWIQTPVINVLNALGCKPLHITGLAVILGVMAALALSRGNALLGVVLIWLSGYCDMLDGALARLQNSTSELGGLLDVLGDRVVEASLCIGLIYAQPTLWLAGPILLASILLCVTAFLLVGLFSSQQPQKSFYYSPGLMERAEAFIVFSAIALFPSQGAEIAYVGAGLILYTSGSHVRSFARQMAQ